MNILEIGKEIGKEIGEARMGKLIGILLSQNLIEEAKKVTDDKEERERYYILYNIQATTVKLEGGIERMCNLSEGVELRGYRRGRQEGTYSVSVT